MDSPLSFLAPMHGLVNLQPPPLMSAAGPVVTFPAILPAAELILHHLVGKCYFKGSSVDLKKYFYFLFVFLI